MLRHLDTHSEFIPRHICPSPADQQTMLAAIGVPDLDTLVSQVVPHNICSEAPFLDLPGARSEVDALAELKAIASGNQVFRSYIGQGYYGTHVPHVILRNILENPAWYTAYTPYQAEISQGRLEALINIQTLVSDPQGLENTNASHLATPTAPAEPIPYAPRPHQTTHPIL